MIARIPPSTPGPRARGKGAAPRLPHPYTPYPELIINFCPTGMVPTRAMTPHVPISPAAVIDDACRALELGASIVHLHARERDGTPSYRAELYETMILGIRAHVPEAIICVSCSGRNFPEFERRSEVLDLSGRARADLASLTLTSLDFPTGTSQNSPEMVVRLAERMAERGVKPELECFDFGMINAANLLITKGLAAPPFYFNLLLGSRYSAPATARHLSAMLVDLPPDSLWSGAGIGLFQLPMNTLAIAMGGHCRVGLEDNIYYGFDRSELATNTALVARVKQLSEIFGRPLANPARARAMLGLGPSAGTRSVGAATGAGAGA
ncbi:MAG TPA: 3-keto-5-aminohexanoate cleavage protein [Gemmatimonadales bacterium]|nr:3-keto-5-aminohexanoate cleavage protein [Gemmatimonadales bacterium]